MDYAKINELSDAIGYCQIFDACGCTIQLDKLNYAPGTKKERLSNFKILSKALRKNNVAADIPLERLANSNFQANCEFLQFCLIIYIKHTQMQLKLMHMNGVEKL